MKNKVFERLFISCLNLLGCFFALFPFFESCCALTTSKNWSIAKAIQFVENKNNSNYLSGTLIDEQNDFSSYYGASYFYSMQKISRFYSDQIGSNNLFFQYEQKDEHDLFAVNIGDKYVSTSLFLSPGLDAAYKFNFKLKFGKKLNSNYLKNACEYVYISENLAKELAVDNDTLSNLMLPIKMTFLSKNNIVDTYKKVYVAGVIDEDSLGLYKAYLKNQSYIFTNWSEDLQTMINCPTVNVLFGDDMIMNKTYIDYISSYSLKFYINDEIGGCISENLTNYVFSSNNDMKYSHILFNFILWSVIIQLLLLIFILFISYFKISNLVFNDLKKNNFIYFVISLLFISLYLKYSIPLYLDSLYLVLNEGYAFVVVSFVFIVYFLNKVVKNSLPTSAFLSHSFGELFI